MATKPIKINSSAVLQSWLKHQGITPAEFSRDLGYKNPKIVYDVLSPTAPRSEVTFSMVGRMLKAYRDRAIDVALAITQAIN